MLGSMDVHIIYKLCVKCSMNPAIAGFLCVGCQKLTTAHPVDAHGWCPQGAFKHIDVNEKMKRLPIGIRRQLQLLHIIRIAKEHLA